MLDFETDERLSSVSITEPTGVEDGRGDTGDKTGVVGVIVTPLDSPYDVQED